MKYKTRLKFTALKLRARLLNLVRIKKNPNLSKLHFGCGRRHVEGWLNVDLIRSDHDVDLTDLPLPWATASFQVIASQQVVEHLDLYSELLPLLTDLRRILAEGGEAWISCPDMEKICAAYHADKGKALLASRMRRWPDFLLGAAPTQHIINDYFHQRGEHKNLFDFELLEWVLLEAGFSNVIKKTEQDFMARFPEFPYRDDDDCSLYVVAYA